jgi:hypothetical protein
MRVAVKMPYLQQVRGEWRVRIKVPLEVRPHLPAPHTGKHYLTKALGTGIECEANRLAIPHIAELKGIIERTESFTSTLGELKHVDGLWAFRTSFGWLQRS